MHEWLGKTIKTHALQDAPIIRRGPEGSDYGIDGDIWEHYGLGKKPLPPKEMDVNYDFNLIGAKPSHRTYATPEGYPTLDTSTESIPYEDTHYARWSKAKTEEAKTAHAEAAGITSNTTNVQAEVDTSPDDDMEDLLGEVTEALGSVIGASGFH